MTTAPVPSLRRLTVAALVATAFLLPAGATFGAGETVTVSTLEDVTDFVGSQRVEDLPGPDGRVSFREACLATSNTPGPQTIAFAIPTAEWWLDNNMAILRLEDGAFLVNGDETTLDFTTQTDFTGDTNPNGWEVGIYGLQANGWGVAAMFINADNCVIKGLDRVSLRGYGVEIRGDNNRVVSCTISGPLYAGVKVQGNVGDPATGNVIGGTVPDERNVLSAGNAGVRIDGPTDGTVVIGNTLVGSPFAGVQIRGAYCCPEYTPYNTRIGGPTPEERNWIADNGKYGEEGFPLGSQVAVEWAVGTLVEGNYIGTTEDGAARFPGAHGTAGVSVRESTDTVIRDNLISGIRRQGVNHHSGRVYGSAVSVVGPNTGVVMQGNLIGTNASGQAAVPNLNGITFGWLQGYASGALIGGPAAGDANVIAFNERYGVTVADGINGVTLDRNSMHSNGLLGIDLLSPSGEAGPSMNDVGDGDAGGNGLQNFPVLDSAESTGMSVTIAGTLSSSPGDAFIVQFFASDACHASKFGEGAAYLGEATFITDAGGIVPVLATLEAAVPAGSAITATATRVATGDTSEFSTCVTAEGVTITGDVDGNGLVNLADLLMVLTAWGPCGGCPEDLDGDGDVGFADLLLVLGNWS